MAIKIADKFVKASKNENVKLMDASDVAYDSTADGSVENANDVQTAIDNLNSFINAEPLFAIIPTENQIYDSVNNIYRIPANKQSETKILIKNTSRIGSNCQVYLTNMSTNTTTTYSMVRGGQLSLSLGKITTSGTYHYTITGNDSFSNSMKPGIYNSDGSITKIDGESLIITIEVICGDLSLDITKMEKINSISDDKKINITDNILLTSSTDDIVKNTVNIYGTIQYPDINSSITQKIIYSLYTQNIYQYVDNEYVSIYDNFKKEDKEYTQIDFNKIKESKNINFSDKTKLYYRLVSNDGFEIFKPINDFSTGTTVNNDEYYIDSNDIVYLFNNIDIELGRHDSINDNINFSINDIYFLTPIRHILNIKTEVYDGEIKVAESQTIEELYPTIYTRSTNSNGFATNADVQIVSSIPENLTNISENDMITLNCMSFSTYKGISDSFTVSIAAYKYDQNDEEYRSDPAREYTITGLKNESKFTIRVGTLPSGSYKFKLSFDFGSGIKTSNDNWINLFIQKSESASGFTKTGLVAYWTAENRDNTMANADTWTSVKFDSDNNDELVTDDSFYIKLNNLDFTSNSINGWKTENDYKQFLRFTGKSYGVAYINNGQTIKPFKITDIFDDGINGNKNEFSFEILYRTSCVGEMSACVISSRKEESCDDINYMYSDSDKIVANPGITIAYNKAIMCSDGSYITTPIHENEWKHVCFVFNQLSSDNDAISGDPSKANYNPLSTMRIYVDGVLTSVTNIDNRELVDGNNKIFTNAAQMILNGHMNEKTNTIEGFGNCDISLMRLYSTALSNDEVYNNYKSTKNENIVAENNDLISMTNRNNDAMPTLYLMRNVYTGDKEKRKKNVTNTTFSNMFNITDKAASKINCVNCTGLFTYKEYSNDGSSQTINVIHNNIDVYLQGTSTLQFPVKNLRLRYYEDQYETDSDGNIVKDDNENPVLVLGGKPNSDSKIYVAPPNKKDEWIPDYIYTLKADYMESAHLNNTPTAVFYEKVVNAVSRKNGNSTISIDENMQSDEIYTYTYTTDSTNNNETYCIDDNTGEFITVNSYMNKYNKDSFGGNRYRQIKNNTIPEKSPGRSYFEYLTEDEVYDNGSSNILYSPNMNEIKSSNDVSKLAQYNNLYFKEYYVDSGFKWIKYDIENDDHAGKILYKLHTNYKDAIDGFACRVYVSDADKFVSGNESEYYNFTNLGDSSIYKFMGTMMFNYDKTAKALGLENKPVFEDEYEKYIDSVINSIKQSTNYLNEFQSSEITYFDRALKNSLIKYGISDSDQTQTVKSGEYTYSVSITKNTSIDDNEIDRASSVIDSDNYISLSFLPSAGAPNEYTILLPIITFDKFFKYTNKKGVESYKIPVYHYPEIYTENLKNSGKYILDSNEFIFGSSDKSYDQKISNYRSYDYIYKEDKNGLYVYDNNSSYMKITDKHTNLESYTKSDSYRLATDDDTDKQRFSRTLLLSKTMCVISCEGATNKNYAAGTFYDIDTSYRTTYTSDYLKQFYEYFTETDGVTPKLVKLFSAIDNDYTIEISPDKTSKLISIDSFISALNNIKVSETETVNIANTYNSIDDFKKILKFYKTKDSYVSASDGTVLFINSNGVPVQMTDAFDSTTKLLNDTYSIVPYDPNIDYDITDNISLYRYDFALLGRSSSFTYEQISKTDISKYDKVYIYYNDGSESYYKEATDEEKDKEDIFYYRKEKDTIGSTYFSIYDNRSYIGDALTGSAGAYYSYITESFEHRYAYAEEDSDIEDNVDFNMNCWNPLKKAIQWVSDICDIYEKGYIYNNTQYSYDSLDIHHKADTDSESIAYKQLESFKVKFKSEFENYFDLTYALTYYLQMIFLAQADNAGKNSMWDTWDGEKFYIRPYDMDTQCGLNNRGKYVIPPSAEITTKQSARFVKVNEYGTQYGSVSNYNSSTGWADDSKHARFSTFSTQTSRFWDIFRIAYNSEICDTYAYLRNSGIYSFDYVINLYKNMTSRVIGEKFYNSDMLSKYLSRTDSMIYAKSATTAYLPLIMGNRIDQFEDWFSKRIMFCDTYFDFHGADTINTQIQIRTESTSTKYVGIKTYSPIYVTSTIKSDTNKLCTYIDTASSFMDGVNTVNGIEFGFPLEGYDGEISIYGSGNIREIYNLNSLLPKDLILNEAYKLSKIDLSGMDKLTNLEIKNLSYIRELNISNCTALTNPIDLSNAMNLIKLEISDSSASSIKLSQSAPIESFIAKNVNLTSMEFINLKNLKSIDISRTDNMSHTINSLIIDGCSSLTVLDLSKYENLTSLKISNCESLQSLYLSKLMNLATVQIEKCPNLHIIDASNSNAPYLSSFDMGNIDNINILNLRNSLPVDGINIQLHSTNDCKLQYLYADYSNLQTITNEQNGLSVADNIGILDFKSMHELQNISTISCKKIVTITNLILRYKKDNISNIFMSCSKLKSIKNSFITTETITDDTFKNMFAYNGALSDISSLGISLPISNDMINTGIATSLTTRLDNALRESTLNHKILRTVIDYTRKYKLKEISSEQKSRMKSNILNDKYSNQRYYIKDEYPAYEYISHNMSELTTLNVNESLISKLDKYISNGMYIKYSPCVDKTTNIYVKVENINILNQSVISSVNKNNADTKQYCVNSSIVCIKDSSGYRFYVYDAANSEFTEIKNFYTYNKKIMQYYKLYDITDDNFDGEVYEATYIGNTLTSLYATCQSSKYVTDIQSNYILHNGDMITDTLTATDNGNTRLKYLICDDTFDGATNVTSLYQTFYASSVIRQNDYTKFFNKVALMSYKAFNKIGIDRTNSVNCQNTFANAGINIMDYRMFKDVKQNKVLFKAGAANGMFHNGFSGFVNSDTLKNSNNDVEYKYYIDLGDDNYASILPETLTNTSSMFYNGVLPMSKYDVNRMLSGLTKITDASAMFYNCINIKSMANKPLKDMIACTNYRAMFASCANLNIYNGDDVPYGMLPSKKDSSNNELELNDRFTLFDYTMDNIGSQSRFKSSNNINMSGIFANCTSLTGYIYKNIFAVKTKSGSVLGAANISTLGSTTVTNKYIGGAFSNTGIISYDKEFLENLTKLTSIDALFAKYDGNNIVNTYKLQTNSISYLLSGYYDNDTYHPGIPIDLFDNNISITTTKFAFAGNYMLYLSNEDNDEISEKLNDKFNENKESGISSSYNYRKTIISNMISNTDISNIERKYGAEYDQDISDTIYQLSNKNRSIFDNLKNLTDVSAMFANTSITTSGMTGLSTEDDIASLNKIICRFGLKSGVCFDESTLFRNNRNIKNISALFENSVYHTSNDYLVDGVKYINDDMLVNCPNITNVSYLFRNNLYQKAMPTNNFFNSQRQVLIYASGVFDGCINIDASFIIGNNLPLVAYKNMLDVLKTDNRFSLYKNYESSALIDTLESAIVNGTLNSYTVPKFSEIELIFNNYSDNINYKMYPTLTKFSLTQSNEYSIVENNGNVVSPKIIISQNKADNINIFSQYVYKLSDIDHEHDIKFIKYVYVEDNSLSDFDTYYKLTIDDDVTHISKNIYDINITDIDSNNIEKDSSGNFVKYRKSLHIGISIPDSFDKDYLYNGIFNLYKVNNLDDINTLSQIGSNCIICEYINSDENILTLNLDSQYTLSQFTGSESVSYDASVDNYRILALPVFIIDDSKSVNEKFYKYSDGLFGSMPKLQDASAAFRNCKKLYDAIPEDIFSSKSQKNNLKELTNISYLFAGCNKLGLTASTGADQLMLTREVGPDSSNRYASGYTSSPNRQYMYMSSLDKTGDIDCYCNSDKLLYEFDTTSNSDRYLIPEDWLSSAPSIKDVSYMLQGITNLSNELGTKISGGYAYDGYDGDSWHSLNSNFTNTSSVWYLKIPNKVFNKQTSINNLDGVFANIHIATGDIDSSMISNFVNQITTAKYTFFYTAITGIGTTTRMFESKNGKNTTLKTVQYLFGKCSRISDIQSGYPRFANPSKFTQNIGSNNGANMLKAFYYTNLTIDELNDNELKTYSSAYRNAVNTNEQSDPYYSYRMASTPFKYNNLIISL